MEKLCVFLPFLLVGLALNGQDTQKQDSLLNILKDNPPARVEIETYLELGNVYQYNTPDSAERYFERAKNGALHLNDYNTLVRSLIGLGNCYAFWCDYEKALGIYLEALSYSERLKDRATLATCYSSIGIIYADRGIYDTTIMYFQKSLEIFETLKDTAGLAKCYNNIGLVYDCQGKYNQAIQEYTKSMGIDIRQNNQSGLSVDYNNIGSVYFNKGNYAKALDYYFKSLKIREQLGDKNGIAQCCNNIAIAHSNMHNNGKAVEYYNKSLSIKLELKDLRGIASCYNNIGSQFYETRNYPKALEFFIKSLEIRKSLNDLDGIGQCNDNIAVVYSDMGQYKDALSYYFKNIKTHETIGDREGLSLTYINVASSYNDLGSYSQAINFALKGLSAAKEIENLNLQRAAYSLLSSIYGSTADYKKALDYYILFKQANDTIYSKESSEQLNKLEVQYQAEKKQVEIDKLNQQNELQKLQIRHQEDRNQKIILLSSFTVGSILLIGFFTYTSRKRKQQVLFQRQMAYITQLKMLNTRNRISPHFVFNVLNHEVIAENSDGERFELQGLVKLLRQSLEVTESLCVPLGKELDFVKTYIDVERRSLGDDFFLKWEMGEDIDYNTCMLPSMIVQIPVENAIKHALRGRDGEKILQIVVNKQPKGILIMVVDNGSGFTQPPVERKGTGTGLKVIYQTIELLNACNQEKIAFTISANDSSSGGTHVSIYIPQNYSYEL